MIFASMASGLPTSHTSLQTKASKELMFMMNLKMMIMILIHLCEEYAYFIGISETIAFCVDNLGLCITGFFLGTLVLLSMVIRIMYFGCIITIFFVFDIILLVMVD
ncbi:hypothetical protein Dimus_038500 [Dionaea muscipula]